MSPTAGNSRGMAVVLVTLATFTDIVAYSIAIPVLPDMSRRLGASATTIGLLFGSFGVTLLAVSMPAGAWSDRIGRKLPLAGGMVALSAATLLFAFADRLPWLFTARMVQGAADGITWVVGFALVADLYGPSERGRVTGFVMSGTTFAVMIGPTIGGWLYEVGGPRVPFVAVAALAGAVAVAFSALHVPSEHAPRDIVPVGHVLRTRAVRVCAVVVIAAASTMSMMEPVLALHLSGLGIGPGRIGLVFGIGALASTLMHPLFGRLADRFGARRITMYGLIVMAVNMLVLSHTWSFASTAVMFCFAAAGGALVITPSLAFMGEATSEAGIGSFGVAYGIYNMAWGIGLLSGPSTGGFLYERMGFVRLALVWAPTLILVTLLLARVKSGRIPLSAA